MDINRTLRYYNNHVGVVIDIVDTETYLIEWVNGVIEKRERSHIDIFFIIDQIKTRSAKLNKLLNE